MCVCIYIFLKTVFSKIVFYLYIYIDAIAYVSIFT